MSAWIVTGTSMVVEADTAEEAVERAEQSSGWHWEAAPAECIDCKGRHISGPDSEGFWDCHDCGAAWLPGLAGPEPA